MRSLLPYAAPYVLYVAIALAAAHLSPYADAIRIALVGAMLVVWAGRGAYPELRDRPSAGQTIAGVAAGLAIGVAWVPLSNLVPSIGETARTGLDPEQSAFLTWLRVADMVVIAPFAEELLFRSAIPRFVDAGLDEDWRRRPVGAFTWKSAAVSVGLFGMTHPEWLAALVTGALWTAVLAKTRNLRTVIVAHAVANAWLASHVLVTGENAVVVGSAAVTTELVTPDPARPLALPPSARWMWVRLAGLLAIPPVVWALARFDVLPKITLCLFERVTHLPCPGCGMTRSVLRLSLGDVAGSLRMHPLGVVFAGLLVATIAGTLVGLARGGDPVVRFLERRGAAFVISLVVVLLVTWVVRAFLVPEWAPGPVE